MVDAVFSMFNGKDKHVAQTVLGLTRKILLQAFRMMDEFVRHNNVRHSHSLARPVTVSPFRRRAGISSISSRFECASHLRTIAREPNCNAMTRCGRSSVS